MGDIDAEVLHFQHFDHQSGQPFIVFYDQYSHAISVTDKDWKKIGKLAVNINMISIFGWYDDLVTK